MNRTKIAILAIVCPLLFSCGHKSGIKTTEAIPSQEIVSENKSKKESKIQEWVIAQTSSQIKFSIKNMGMKVDGTMGGFRGHILFDEKDLAHSEFEVEADVSTINTGINKRDKDLMAEKYFDDKSFKFIVFQSDSIIRKGNEFIVTGGFMLKGISQHRRLPFTFEQSADVGTFKSNFIINRLDFGIGGNGRVMGTDAEVSVELVTNKKQALVDRF